MDSFSLEIRKQLFWKPHRLFNYGKLHRHMKLPFDEKNVERGTSSNFYQFIVELLSRSIASNVPEFGSYFDIWLPHHTMILDEIDGFNFITCVTSDTFWSIADLFVQPYQSRVWHFLALSLLTSGVLVAVS
jgi:hypothetical protein